jgi:thiol-disulfide isomerase/thioredoxin
VAGWRTVLISLAVAACASAPQTAPHTPEIPTQLGSMLAGRPALVSLWATWCDSCRDEMPALVRLDAYARDHGAVVVGVAVGERIDHVTRFVADRKLSYAQLVDEDFHLADALGERNIPTTLVVDRAGHIVFTGRALDERALSAFRDVVAKHD